MNGKEKNEERKGLKLLVTKQVPTQEVRRLKDDDGNEYEIMTEEEALTEILTMIRQIHSAL